MNIDNLKSLIKNSPFNKSHYSVTIPLSSFFKSLSLYINDSDYKSNDYIFDAIPSFQRNNDKWTKSMQLSFIENIILGYKTEVILFEINPIDCTPMRAFCKILDGLQRITALYEFFEGNIKPFGYSIDELNENRILRKFNNNISVKIFSFRCMEQAINFYIAYNENISHSQSDIDKARNILNNLDTWSCKIDNKLYNIKAVNYDELLWILKSNILDNKVQSINKPNGSNVC